MKKNFLNNNFMIGNLIFLFSMVFLSWSAQFVDAQATFDAAYYHIMVDQLEQGKGFSEPIIWNYLSPRNSIEHPMDYWMPAGIILYYIARSFAGVAGEVGLNILIWSFLSTVLFFWVYQKTFCLFSSSISFITILLCGRNFFYLLTTDNIAFYAAIGLAFLFLLNSDKYWPLKAGMIASIAVLTRIEGTLIAVYICFLQFLRGRKIILVLALMMTIIIAVFPWALRNKLVLGKFWTSNLKSLLIVDYSDIFCAEFPGSWENFASQGITRIIRQRINGLWVAFLNLLIVPGLFAFYPLWMSGTKVLWNNQGFIFAGLLLTFILFCGLLVPLQAERGTAMHISAFFYPFFAILNGIGFNFFAKKFAASKKQMLMVLFLIFCWSGFATWFSVKNLTVVYDKINAPYQELSELLPGLKNKNVASSEPIRVYLETGAKGVILSGFTSIPAEALAEKYGCTTIVLDNRSANFKQNLSDAFEEIASSAHLLIFEKIR